MAAALELWGGVECTVSRCGDEFVDQLELTGHAHRLDDIDRIASLGVRTVRYPVLWERTAPQGLASPDWDWADERLALLRSHGITQVIGLTHHGSGPLDTSLADPEFPAKLARYATACLRRYPWMECVTPVNEPLTTARFSGLYGHWYPHGTSDACFVRLLLNQCRAVRDTMSALRDVNPSVRLVQTEDLGYAHSSRDLVYQAHFENLRRWLTWDLLCGRVTRDHEMYRYLRTNGASVRELDDLARRPCPPDIIGIDHYVTSERFLDSNVDDYAECTIGGNGRQRYADVEVARAQPELRRGIGSLLRETWDRYGIPIVVTEAHLSCDDELERVRWLMEIWNGASAVRAEGCDVRAVTAWALFGACGWDGLATRSDGRYEAGAFDVGGGTDGTPRESALVPALRALASTGCYDSDFLASPGWWQGAHPVSSSRATAAVS